MKVVYDHQIFCSQKYGGISRYFFELISRLSSFSGMDAEIVSPLYVNNYIHHNTRIKVTGLHIPKFSNSALLLRKLNMPLTRLLINKRRPDIVHETYFNSSKVATTDSKTVLTVYDMIHEKYPEIFSGMDATIRRKKEAILHADHVICISEQTRKDLLELYQIQPENVSTVYLANSLSKPDNQAPPVIKEPYLFYVGHRKGHKNFQLLLDAYAASNRLAKDYKLVAFGGGDVTPDEKRILSNRGAPLESLICLSGNDEMLVNLYQYAHAYVCPSLYEGFGLPVIEAMSLGCPVVTSNRGSLLEVAGDAAGFFNPEDSDDLLHALEDIVYSDTRRQQLIALGYKQSERFSWDRCAQETYDIYKGLVDNK